MSSLPENSFAVCGRMPMLTSTNSTRNNWMTTPPPSTPDMPLLPVSFLNRIVKANDGCWNWVGAKNNRGYGNYRSKSAHRMSYEANSGEKIPEGMTIDHICRNTSCVNPDH